MRPPLDSVDPVAWLVWADWCAECDPGCEQVARRVAADLNALHGAGVGPGMSLCGWLDWPASGGISLFTRGAKSAGRRPGTYAVAIDLDPKDRRPVHYRIDPGRVYDPHWQWRPTMYNWVTPGVCEPLPCGAVTPADLPDPFAEPELSWAFFDACRERVARMNSGREAIT